MGLLSATLFAVYPASIYSSWTMSEAVAIPVFLWLFWLLAELLVAPTKWKVAAAGVAAGLALLSRPQGLFTVPSLLLLAGLTRPRELVSWARLLQVGILGAILAGLVWWKLGYISMSGNALTYLPNLENTPTLLQLVPRGLYQIFLHATALWMEGALLLPTLGILGLWLCFRDRGHGAASGEPSGDPNSDNLLARFTALCSGFLLIAVSLFVARFLPDEGARPVLRYAVYSNLVLIPFAAKALLGCTLSASQCVRVTAALSILFAQPLLWPKLWKQLAELGGYFSNAPALDVYMQMNALPGRQVALLTASVSFVAVNLCLRYRAIAVALPLILSLVVACHAWGVCIGAPRESHERMGFSDIHAFCREVETGRWRETPIYTQWTPHVDYLRRYVKFFTGFPNIHDGPAPPEETDYLFLTFDTVPEATLEWEGERLHAYRMNPPPSS
ncbi:MAG: hypothetical protein HUU16_08735 [Candidatus Omnitrophica bacterium]|nr:hypothetical protein [Candidatus Omnitrophota bacterium]